MRRVLLAVSAVIVSIGSLALVPAHASLRPVPPPQSHGRATGSPIQHVVVIYQENHTFDDMLGDVCRSRPTPCNGYVGPVTFADGKTADDVHQDDIVPEVDHSPYSQRLAMNNRWDGIKGCTRRPYYCVSHVNRDDIPNLARLADTFAVSDATFAAGRSASFGAHVTLAAGTIDGFAGNNPVRSTRGVRPRTGWGCQSRLDALWGPKRNRSYQPSCIPDVDGHGPYRKSSVAYVPTVMQGLESAGLSWHIYAGTNERKPSKAPLQFCTYFYWCLGSRFDLDHNSSRTEFLADAKAGTLPTVSFLIPVGDVSQHNGLSMSIGDNYIGAMVSAVEESPDWGSTVIFITYDDCGCFYDHVTPPSRDFGLRNPMVIVSPYAKPGSTDSRTAIQPYSMLAFIQHNFGLGSLTKGVDGAYDYADSFDFSQRPLPGPPMTRQPVSPMERRESARNLPAVRADPT